MNICTEYSSQPNETAELADYPYEKRRAFVATVCQRLMQYDRYVSITAAADSDPEAESAALAEAFEIAMSGAAHDVLTSPFLSFLRRIEKSTNLFEAILEIARPAAHATRCGSPATRYSSMGVSGALSRMFSLRPRGSPVTIKTRLLASRATQARA